MYHRRFSPTQPDEVTLMIALSGEVWGKAPRGEDEPAVQAYAGPLPDGLYGVWFETELDPVEWAGIEVRWYARTGAQPFVLGGVDWVKIQVHDVGYRLKGDEA